MVAKKLKLKKTKTTRRVVKRTAPPRARADRTIEIVFSYDEIDFLRKITGKGFKASPPADRAARLSLRDKLLDIGLERSSALSGGLIVIELNRAELGLLQRITKEVYSFITPEERRARLILREKILIAVEKMLPKRFRGPGS
jgi:hypothetical protein